MSACRSRAVLLIGPTGSGKTPLGQELERRGLWGKRCLHFDFGLCLRRIVSGEASASSLDGEQIAVLAGVLGAGALLEDTEFPIARRILGAFLAEHDARCEALLVLNGLPRHVGQAEGVDEIVDVESVISLSCTPHVVLGRIRTNAGGDRSGRADDDLDAVRHRLEVFARRTAPLLEHYRDRGARVESVDVGLNTTPEEILQELERRR